MGTAAPFVKLLRQLASAKDDYRTGALDITWDGGRAMMTDGVAAQTESAQVMDVAEILAARLKL